MPKCLTFLLAAWFISMSACMALAEEVKSAGRVKIIAGILPVAYFVERVGGPYVDVTVLVGPGQDPHTFELTPRLVAKLADAQVIFKVGFPFEETLVRKAESTFRNLKVVDIQQGVKMHPMNVQEAAAAHSQHGGEEKHEHGGVHRASDMDPHTWLDPRLAKIQARTIADKLIQIDPARKDDYEKNLNNFQHDLDAVNEQLTKALAPVKGKSFFVFHPAYGYFGDAYGLKQVPVQIGGKEPTAKQLARLMDLAKKNGVRVIFVQPQFSKKSAEALAEGIGGAVVSMDDLAPDYLKNLHEMADKLDSALRVQKN